nr:PREDICTED: DUF724 domain-containing protein 3-like [Daucus carota subsp. sativus]
MAYNFRAGSRVEVRSDEEGFRGAYYVATVLEDPKFEQCIVVYDQLSESEDPNSRNLTEKVHVSRLRPLPPLSKGEMIKVHDNVDAYYNDGWWPGEIVESLQDGKFLVYFADPPDQQVVERNDLRHHLEWANGKWKKPRRKSQIYKMITQGSAVEVTFERENYSAWHVGNVLQVKGNNKFLVKFQFLGVDNKPACTTETVDFPCIRPFPPQLEEQDFSVLDKVDVYYNLGWWSGVIHRILNDMRYVVITQANVKLICICSHLRPRLDWIDGKWTITSRNTQALLSYNEPLKSNRTRTPSRKQQAKKYRGTAGTPYILYTIIYTYIPLLKNLHKYTGKMIDDAVRADEPDMHVHEELGTLSETPVNEKVKRHISDQNKQCIEGSSGTKRTRNRKRGRPQKVSLENQIGKDNLMLTTVDNQPAEGHFTLSCENQSDKTGASTRVKMFLNESLCDAHPELMPDTYLAEDQVAKESLIERHGETSNIAGTQSQNQGVKSNIPVVEHQDTQTIAGNGATTNGSASKAQDVPLYQCANASYGESNNDASSAYASKAIIPFSPLQKTDANYPTCEPATPSAIISCDGRDKNVPFFKSSPLWKSLESMEIFNRTQLKPHFNPLAKCREETREGLAIGHMVTFSSVAEKTLNLRFSDPSSVIINNLKTLVELEKQGFDVEPIRARSMTLLAKKEQERKLEAEYKMIENEITNSEHEKDRLSQEKIQIKATMKELVEKLSWIDSEKGRKDEKISTLRSRQEAIRERVRGVEDEFENAANCPFN